MLQTCIWKEGPCMLFYRHWQRAWAIASFTVTLPLVCIGRPRKCVFISQPRWPKGETELTVADHLAHSYQVICVKGDHDIILGTLCDLLPILIHTSGAHLPKTADGNYFNTKWPNLLMRLLHGTFKKEIRAIRVHATRYITKGANLSCGPVIDRTMSGSLLFW